MKKVFTSLILAAYLLVGFAASAAAAPDLSTVDPQAVLASSTRPDSPPVPTPLKFRRHLAQTQTFPNAPQLAAIDVRFEQAPITPELPTKELHINVILLFRAEILREFRSPPGA